MADKLPTALEMDDFNRWKIDDLKKFIKERGHKTTYRVKRELVAVAFALNQQNCRLLQMWADWIK